MNITLKVRDREFGDAVRHLAKRSNTKTVPDILNHKTPYVIQGAMRRTPKVAKGKIVAELGTPGSPKPLALRIVYARARRLKKRLTRQEARLKARAMIRARMGAVRYVSLGWLKSLSSWRSVAKPLKSNSLAAKGGYGIRATPFRHYTKFANAAPGAFRGADALEAAIAAEVSDTVNYAARSMQKAANRHNPVRK